MGSDSTAIHDMMQKFLYMYVPDEMHDEAEAELGSVLAESVAVIARHITQCAHEEGKRQPVKKSTKSDKPKCTATKKDGTVCGASALPNNTLCGRHSKETL